MTKINKDKVDYYESLRIIRKFVFNISTFEKTVNDINTFSKDKEDIFYENFIKDYDHQLDVKIQVYHNLIWMPFRDKYLSEITEKSIKKRYVQKLSKLKELSETNTKADTEANTKETTEETSESEAKKATESEAKKNITNCLLKLALKIISVIGIKFFIVLTRDTHEKYINFNWNTVSDVFYRAFSSDEFKSNNVLNKFNPLNSIFNFVNDMNSKITNKTYSDEELLDTILIDCAYCLIDKLPSRVHQDEYLLSQFKNFIIRNSKCGLSETELKSIFEHYFPFLYSEDIAIYIRTETSLYNALLILHNYYKVNIETESLESIIGSIPDENIIIMRLLKQIREDENLTQIDEIDESVEYNINQLNDIMKNVIKTLELRNSLSESKNEKNEKESLVIVRKSNTESESKSELESELESNTESEHKAETEQSNEALNEELKNDTKNKTESELESEHKNEIEPEVKEDFNILNDMLSINFDDSSDDEFHGSLEINSQSNIDNKFRNDSEDSSDDDSDNDDEEVVSQRYQKIIEKIEELKKFNIKTYYINIINVFKILTENTNYIAMSTEFFNRYSYLPLPILSFKKTDEILVLEFIEDYGKLYTNNKFIYNTIYMIITNYIFSSEWNSQLKIIEESDAVVYESSTTKLKYNDVFDNMNKSKSMYKNAIRKYIKSLTDKQYSENKDDNYSFIERSERKEAKIIKTFISMFPTENWIYKINKLNISVDDFLRVFMNMKFRKLNKEKYITKQVPYVHGYNDVVKDMICYKYFKSDSEADSKEEFKETSEKEFKETSDEEAEAETKKEAEADSNNDSKEHKKEHAYIPFYERLQYFINEDGMHHFFIPIINNTLNMYYLNLYSSNIINTSSEDKIINEINNNRTYSRIYVPRDKERWHFIILTSLLAYSNRNYITYTDIARFSNATEIFQNNLEFFNIDNKDLSCVTCIVVGRRFRNTIGYTYQIVPKIYFNDYINECQSNFKIIEAPIMPLGLIRWQFTDEINENYSNMIFKDDNRTVLFDVATDIFKNINAIDFNEYLLDDESVLKYNEFIDIVTEASMAKANELDNESVEEDITKESLEIYNNIKQESNKNASESASESANKSISKDFNKIFVPILSILNTRDDINKHFKYIETKTAKDFYEFLEELHNNDDNIIKDSIFSTRISKIDTNESKYAIYEAFANTFVKTSLTKFDNYKSNNKTLNELIESCKDTFFIKQVFIDFLSTIQNENHTKLNIFNIINNISYFCDFKLFHGESLVLTICWLYRNHIYDDWIQISNNFREEPIIKDYSVNSLKTIFDKSIIDELLKSENSNMTLRQLLETKYISVLLMKFYKTIASFYNRDEIKILKYIDNISYKDYESVVFTNYIEEKLKNINDIDDETIIDIEYTNVIKEQIQNAIRIYESNKKSIEERLNNNKKSFVQLIVEALRQLINSVDLKIIRERYSEWDIETLKVEYETKQKQIETKEEIKNKAKETNKYALINDTRLLSIMIAYREIKNKIDIVENLKKLFNNSIIIEKYKNNNSKELIEIKNKIEKNLNKITNSEIKELEIVIIITEIKELEISIKNDEELLTNIDTQLKEAINKIKTNNEKSKEYKIKDAKATKEKIIKNLNDAKNIILELYKCKCAIAIKKDVTYAMTKTYHRLATYTQLIQDVPNDLLKVSNELNLNIQNNEINVYRILCCFRKFLNDEQLNSYESANLNEILNIFTNTESTINNIGLLRALVKTMCCCY